LKEYSASLKKKKRRGVALPVSQNAESTVTILWRALLLPFTLFNHAKNTGPEEGHD
jgi:hypothetical protein